MADEDKRHVEIMTQLQDLNTKFELLIKPAITQTYNNKDDIIKIKSFQSVAKYVGGLISTLMMFVAIRSLWDWIKH